MVLLPFCDDCRCGQCWIAPKSTEAHSGDMGNLGDANAALRYTVGLVALLNLGYFGVEFAVAVVIGSVSLFADSIDFLEDAAVNGLILVALGWNPRRRSMAGTALAAIL